MKYRKSNRLLDRDYSKLGAYYVTLCTRNRENLLSDIINGQSVLSPYGEIVEEEWKDLDNRFAHIELDAFTIMPNHLHAIVHFVGAALAAAQTGGTSAGAGSRSVEPTSGVVPAVWAGASPAPTKCLGKIIGTFKSLSYRRCRNMFNKKYPDKRFGRLWQRNYHDRVIRDDIELNEKRDYIRSNPKTWADDENNISKKSPF